MPFVSRPRRRRGPPIGGSYPGLTTQRNLINFRAVMQSYVSIPEVTATGDFEYAFSIYIPDAADNSVLISRSTEESRTVSVRSDGSLRFHFGTTFRDTSGIDVRNSRVYDIVVSRTGTRAVVTANGVTVLDQTSLSIAGDYIMGAIMRRDGAQQSSYVSGFMFNFRCVSGFDSNPTYPLDDTLINSNVIRNSAATLGSELSTVADPLTSNPIGGSAFSFYPIGNVVSGNTYILEADVSGYQGSGDVGFRSAQGVNLGGGVRVIQADGRIHIVFEATGTGPVDFFTQSSNQCIFSNTTLREAPGYGTAFGLGAADSEPYTLLTDDGYLQNVNNYTGGALSGTVNTTVSNLVSGGVYRMILSNPTNVDITFTSGANSVVISAGSTQADLTLAANNVVITGSGVTTAFTPRVSRLLEFV